MKKLIPLIALCLLLPMKSCGQKQTTKSAAAAAPTATQGVTVMSLPTVTGNQKTMDVIKAAFKGKVMVVDFWATWCGPCRMAMKQIVPVKEKYQKDRSDVAFVYITGETSPKGDWDAAIKSIPGYHYRLSGAQFEALCQDLGLIGFPSYMVIDKKGNVSYNNLSVGGYPGNEVISQEIEKAL